MYIVHMSFGSQAGSRDVGVSSRKGQVGPVQQQELYRGRGGDVHTSVGSQAGSTGTWS